ncbi:hypothetical protein Bca52824_027207 [Brassica carinata]|uniref:Uncharacterized protein n=1 Tax=Brassica carinata TaxID=52824 RepID=A0A8X7SI27_BRACI|nr:hypothetical protein Bca52824_027207 [Brassica carinata]
MQVSHKIRNHPFSSLLITKGPLPCRTDSEDSSAFLLRSPSPKDLDPSILRNLSVAVDSSSSATHTAQTYPAMVVKAKRSQSSVAPRPISTAEKVAKSPPAKQPRYPG